MCILVLAYWRINAQRKERMREELSKGASDEILAERRKLGDKAVDFIYSL